jgi:hypothetical protein
MRPAVLNENLTGSCFVRIDAHLAEHNSTSQWYFGNLGMDLLNEADRVTVDFQTLTLRLD